jgi:DNA-binding XRE family transcriptional regulator
VAFRGAWKSGRHGDQSTQAGRPLACPEELALPLTLTAPTSGSIERQKYAASIEVVERLAKGLGIEASELLQAPLALDVERVDLDLEDPAKH